MFCVRRIRSPHPYVLGRPLPCIGSASPVAVKPSIMANPLDKLCWSYGDPTFSLSSTPSPSADSQLTGKLLIECLKNSSEKEQLEERLLSLASELGVIAGGDLNELVDDISHQVRVSEEKRLAAEKRARAVEQKHLDSAMKIQVLEMELAEARRQKDAAVKELQDLTWQPALDCSPAHSLTARVTWCLEGNPRTPSSEPSDTRVAPNPPSTPDLPFTPYLSSTPYNPSTPEMAPYPTTTPDTAPLNTIPVPTGLPRSSPEVSGLVPEVNNPPSALTPAQGSVAIPSSTSQNPRSPSVGGAVATVNLSTAAAPVTSYVWSMDDLESFHPGGGDVILGSGVSATVHLFRHRVTDKAIAVKIFRLPDDIKEMNKKMGYILKEAGLLDTMGRNDCFPSYLGCLETSPGYVGLAMDFVGDSATGESWTLQRGMRELVLSSKQWLQLALNIANSLGCIHEMGYLMNDLKEDNCLLQKTRTSQWEAVIVDFGLVYPRTSPFFCRLSHEDKEKYKRKEVYVHIAPECALDDVGTTVMSDVFQLGRLFKLMGVTAYNAELNSIGNLCVQNSPINRPTIEEIVDLLECML